MPTSRVWKISALAAGSAALLALAGSAEPRFRGLGIPAWAEGSIAIAISADGSVVVGESFAEDYTWRESFRWKDGAMAALNGLGKCSSLAWDLPMGISADGSVIAGIGPCYPRPGGGTLVWNGGAITRLEIPDVHYCQSEPIVAAGGAVYLRCTRTGERDPVLFRWENGSVSDPGLGIGTARIEAVSLDETIFVGRAGDYAARWTNGVLESLGGLTGPPGPGDDGIISGAIDLSDDGSIVVGWSLYPPGGNGFVEATRWEDSTLMRLGRLPGCIRSKAKAVSADGSRVVGTSKIDCIGQRERLGFSFIWEELRGMRRLENVLESDYGFAVPPGWYLRYVEDISADGRVLVGSGVNPAGNYEGWILELPRLVDVDVQPGADAATIHSFDRGVLPVALLGAEGFPVTDVDVERLALGPDRARPIHKAGGHLQDIDGDDRLDLVSHYRIAETGLAAGDTAACVWGWTTQGDDFGGCDSLRSGVSPFGLASLLALPGAARRMEVAGNHAFVAAWEGGLRVVDVSDPRAPAEISHVETLDQARDVAVLGDHAFVTNSAHGVRVIDISDPRHPAEVGAIEDPMLGAAWRITISDGRAFVSTRLPGTGDSALVILDLSEPAEPLPLGALTISGDAHDVAVAGDLAYVAVDSGIAQGLWIVDVSDPAAPARIGILAVDGKVRGVDVKANIAALTNGDVQLIDVTDPSTPIPIGGIETPGLAVDVLLRGHLAYVADHTRGLSFHDIRRPTEPVALATLSTEGNARDLWVRDALVYIANGPAGLAIVERRGRLQ